MKIVLKKTMLCAFLFLWMGILHAQESNVFLDRNYWKENPSIADIETKIKEGHNVAALNKHYFDAVSYALIEKVDNTTIKFLLTQKGNEVNKLTHDGRTYIFWAAYRDNLDMMEFLVSQGAKTDIIDSHGYSLLNFAAVTGQTNTKLYDFCIQHGAEVTKEKNHDGANPLLLVAPFITNYDLVDYFTAKGIDIHATDNRGNGIFNYAAKNVTIPFMDMLIKNEVAFKKVNNEGANAMIFACQGTRGTSNSLDKFQYLEKLGIIPNISTKKGKSPLHYLAAKIKDTTVIDYFLAKGVDINLKDQDGKTALTSAISRNSSKIVDYFIQKGAKTNVIDSKGNNLAYYLFDAFSPKKTDQFDQKLKILRQNGLDITAVQKDGNTLFHLAINKNNIALLEKVHELGIDVNAKNKDGITALHKAAMQSKDDRVLKYLLSIGADKTIKTDFEESVLDLANENELLQKNNVTLNFLK